MNSPSSPPNDSLFVSFPTKIIPDYKGNAISLLCRIALKINTCENEKQETGHYPEKTDKLQGCMLIEKGLSVCQDISPFKRPGITS